MTDLASESPALRPLPLLGVENEDFWTGGAVGELRIHRCEACGYLVHPPVPYCPACASREVRPQPVSGRGVIHSFTVNHQSWFPGLPDLYVLALVELDEQPGLRLTTSLVGCEPGEVRIGLAVQVRFEQILDVWMPFFELVRQPQ